MPKSLQTETRWLEKHGGKWRVTIAVPRDLQKALGTRLKRTLETDSLAVANRIKLQVVDELRAIIEDARERAAVKPNAIVKEALSIAALRRKLLPGDEANIDRAVASRAQDILGKEVGEEFDESLGQVFPVYDPKRKRLAKEFVRFAAGSATPLGIHLKDYLDQQPTKFRTKADDERAVELLTRWCQRSGIDPIVENITTSVARRFFSEVGKMTSIQRATEKKYLSRLRSYWRFMVYKEYTIENPWKQVEIRVPKPEHDEEERAFTDEEVRRLFMGGAPSKLMDVMWIGALTGARLDAIVDLKVRDTLDDAFTFKRQKLEATKRDVPIHSALREIVRRRTEGKELGDDLFPEWPRPRKVGSKRERSFKTSNAFTEYRRACGVEEKVQGKRRSLVNFHSFRRWFVTKAERAGYSGDLIAAIVGHKRSGITLGRYSEGPEWQRACDCVEAVALPPLDGSPIVEARSLTPRRRAS